MSAHPDPTTPNQSNGVNDEKNKTAPVSAHPDPVVPNVQQGVEEKKHDAEKHALIIQELQNLKFQNNMMQSILLNLWKSKNILLTMRKHKKT